MFQTDQPHYLNANNDKLIYPFGPPIFQTEVSDDFINILLEEGQKLTKEHNDASFYLAGNLKNGRSFYYGKNFIENNKKYILEKTFSYIDAVNLASNINLSKDIDLEYLWINFSEKYDFNPTHTHSGFLSFVVYCDVSQNIFENQADSNSPMAGNIIFEYGDAISDDTKNTYSVAPYTGLMFIFSSKLRHFVPPYWADEKRISVSGNIRMIK